jgi:hypothetical protein
VPYAAYAICFASSSCLPAGSIFRKGKDVWEDATSALFLAVTLPSQLSSFLKED